jgi:hypothetical protein
LDKLLHFMEAVLQKSRLIKPLAIGHRLYLQPLSWQRGPLL